MMKEVIDLLFNHYPCAYAMDHSMLDANMMVQPTAIDITVLPSEQIILPHFLASRPMFG